MPNIGKIYYYSPVPLVILDVIGQFAGDINRPLKFTLTPKRKFMGPIFVKSPYKTYRLSKDSWIPRRLGNSTDAARVQQYLYDRLRNSTFFLSDANYLQDLDIVLNCFITRLTQVRNYSLK